MATISIRQTQGSAFMSEIFGKIMQIETSTSDLMESIWKSEKL